MEIIFRKVSAKERLPNKDGIYICFISCCEEPKDGCSTGWGDCNFQDNTFICPEEKVLFWLEEMELPTDERYDKLKSLIETAKEEHEKQIAISPDDIAHYNFQNGYGHALCNLHWKMNNLKYVGSESTSSPINVCEDCGETLTGGYEVKCGKCWVKISNSAKPF